MSEGKLFKAKLQCSNGDILEMAVPGVQKTDGLVLVPETITIKSGKFFLLDKKVNVLDFFLYHEVEKIIKLAVPFREDLH